MIWNSPTVFLRAVQTPCPEHDEDPGQLFGGCLEVLYKAFAANIVDFESLIKSNPNNHILFIETSEEMPDAIIVEDFFQAYAKRGFLKKCNGILVGHPKTRFLNKPPPCGEVQYIENQKNAILSTLKECLSVFCEPGKEIPVCFNLPIGHTDPQFVVPFGGSCVIDMGRKGFCFLLIIGIEVFGVLF